MLISNWLKYTVAKLTDKQLPTPQLDAEVMLAHVLQKDRSWLHANPDHELPMSDLRILDGMVERRCEHEPVAYIVGFQEFYGRKFTVSPDTLTPRPETETLVELALKLIEENKVKYVADIGTGSGCIAITIDLETNSEIKTTGYEISKPALKIAKENAKNLSSITRFIECDITNQDSYDLENHQLVVANLPYVPTDFNINLAASHEPEFAIFGGKDGLDYYRHLFKKLGSNNRWLITESLPPQHQSLEDLASNNSYTLVESEDFIQVFERA